MSTSTFTPGTKSFIDALAKQLAARGLETIDTLPEDENILEKPHYDTPFGWIAEGTKQLGSPAKGETVRAVIDAMGLVAFVCPGSGHLIGGELAKRGFAFGIGSDRLGDTITAHTLSQKVRGIIDVLPPQH